MIAISACLVGVNCRYDGGNKLIQKLKLLEEQGDVIIFCPEQLGGLSTPRKPTEIIGGDGEDVLNGIAKVVSKDGEDFTREFIDGAYESLKLLKENNITTLITKEGSPSCGFNQIYDGNFNGNLKNGRGVAISLFKKNNIEIISEYDIELYLNNY